MPTVFIWNNNEVSFGHTWSGHASMSIDDIWPRKLNEVSNGYVSWWPNNAETSHSGHSRARPKDNIFADLVAENYAPDHIIVLGVSKANTQAAMLATWESIKNKMPKANDDETSFGPSYRFYRKNCSCIVAKILRKYAQVEGKSSLSIAYRSKSIIWTPLEAKRLALALGGQKKWWRTFIEENLTLHGDEAKGFFLDFKRRDDQRGSSNAEPRFSARGVGDRNRGSDIEGILNRDFNASERAKSDAAHKRFLENEERRQQQIDAGLFDDDDDDENQH